MLESLNHKTACITRLVSYEVSLNDSAQESQIRFKLPTRKPARRVLLRCFSKHFPCWFLSCEREKERFLFLRMKKLL